jgi:phosphohistidine phosphatase
MKTLILLRHAKAEPATAGTDDFDRALTAGGHLAAAQVGVWLANSGPLPGLALVSTARRTQETWADVASHLPESVTPVIRQERALYLASPGDILAILGTADTAIDCVIMVGHNPGFETLARLLSGVDSDATALAAMNRGLPTAGCARFTLGAASWRDVAGLAARLDAFVSPRTLTGSD